MRPRSTAIPRLAPERELPPYSYVPGRFPHPYSDPRGHSHGVTPERPDRPDPERWATCRPYLYGLDLFNHGYYWEAHEVWEFIWHACGRKGTTASFLKGLIKLAASGVKVREGKPRGVRQHALRAAELFEQVATQAGSAYMGLSLPRLIEFAKRLAEEGPIRLDSKETPVSVVFDLVLVPG
jgi:hypothetical protein